MLAANMRALDLIEARGFVMAAERADVPASVGLNFRFIPISEATKSLIAEEQVGTPAISG